jgi:sugar phosphate isomerase/epimerase
MFFLLMLHGRETENGLSNIKGWLGRVNKTILTDCHSMVRNGLRILSQRIDIMLDFSTSWQSIESITAEEMLAALKNLDISGIELSYRISEGFFNKMKSALKHSGLKVVSVHNYFPIPSVRSNSKGSGDLFLLSSCDDEERQNAIRFTAKSIECARDLGAMAVILHCGVVEMNHEMHVLYQYVNSNRLDSEEAQIFLRNKLRERDRRKPQHMDCLLASLDRLVAVAEKQSVLLGLENRYHYHELPGLDDFKVIFAQFKGAPIGYWHDTGHAHANESLGIIPKGSLLQAYATRLIGVHLHDAVGLNDHLPPGRGEIDFQSLKPYLNCDTIKVIELKPGIPGPEVIKGIQFIREMRF